MARTKAASPSLVALAAICLFLMALVGQAYGQQLSTTFYNKTCPNVEEIIAGVVHKKFMDDKTIVAALLRMFFHDCFVGSNGAPGGCEASLLLDIPNAEKTASPNGSVRGYELIEECKAAVDRKCNTTNGEPVVSCADVIAIATKAAVVFGSKGKIMYPVEMGRRDGTVSRAIDAATQLPGPGIPVANAVAAFKTRNINTEQFFYLLAGGHSVGNYHCNFAVSRPGMDPSLASLIKRTCPKNGPNNVLACDQTQGSSNTVDNGFCKAVFNNKGVIPVDQATKSDWRTKNILMRCKDSNDEFNRKFGEAMGQLGRTGVLTGSKGQIRKTCSKKR